MRLNKKFTQVFPYHLTTQTNFVTNPIHKTLDFRLLSLRFLWLLEWNEYILHVRKHEFWGPEEKAMD